MSSRENEGLQTLGRKTEYKMDYAPEVLETFQNKHPENDYWVQFTTTGCSSTVPSSPRCVLSPVSPTLQKSKSCISPASAWWSQRA